MIKPILIQKPSTSFDIVLINTELEVRPSDLYYTRRFGESIEVNSGDASIEWKGPKDNWYHRIVASTNKEHAVPQLTESSVFLLIDYFNKNDKMPKEVVIESLDLREETPGTVRISLPVLIYTEEELTFKLNHCINDILCKRSDKDLLKSPDSNKIATFISKWVQNDK